MSLAAAIIAQFGGDTSQLQKASGDAEGVVSGFASRAGAVLNTLGVALSAGAVLGFFKSIIEKAGALQDLSDELTVSTDALQAFDFRVRQSGGTSEQAVAVWERAKKSLDSLAAGSDSTAKQFAAIGLSARDFIGLNLEQSLQLIARAYADNASAAGAYDSLTDILGTKSTPKLNSALLQLAAEGFPGFIAGAKEAGQVMDQDAIAKMDNFGDRLDAFQGRLTAAGAGAFNFAAKLGDIARAAEQLNPISRALGAVLGDWAKPIGALNPLTDALSQSLGGLSADAKKAASSIATITPALVKTTAELKEQKDIAAAQAKYEDIIARGRREQQTAGAKLLEIQSQMAKYAAEFAAAGDDEIKRYAALNKHAELAVEYRRTLLAEQEKERNATQLAHDENMAWAELEAKALTGLTAEENNRLAALRLQHEEKKLQYQIDQLLEQGVKNLSQEELARLKVLIDQKGKIGEQITGLTQIATATKSLVEEEHALWLRSEALTDSERARLAVLQQQITALQGQFTMVMQIKRVGGGYDSQSTSALKGAKWNLQQQQMDVKSEFGYGSWSANYGATMVGSVLQSEINAIEKEINARGAASRAIANVGEERARMTYGDDIVDRALRDTADAATKTSLTLESIDQRLRNIFSNG